MKVLFHIPFPAIGGAETQIKYLIKNLSPGVHPVVTYEHPEVELFVRSLPATSYRVYSPHNLAKMLEQIRPDIIHFYHSHTMYNALKRAKIKAKTYELVHNRAGFGGDSTSYGKDMTDVVICVSPDAETYFKSKMPDVPTRVIPNGVDTDTFKPAGPKKKRARPLGGFTGRLEPGWGKGVPELITLMAKLPVDFQLVGTDYGGYAKKIKDEGITNITVHKHSKTPEEYYQSWDFFVSYSPSEGFGLSIAEALACGLPAVIFNCGGVCHYIENGKHALIAATDEEMREHLLSCLGEDALKLSPLSLDLSAKKMALQYEALYAELLEGTHRRSQSPQPARASAPLSSAVLGVTPESWLGVRRALSGVCTHYASPQEAVRSIRLLRPKVVVFGCYQFAWENVLLEARALGACTVLTWHASYILNEFNHINREWMFHALKAYKMGWFDFVATPHEGLAATWSHYGIETDFLPNVVEAALPPAQKMSGFNVGILGSGQPWKNMDAQVIGAHMAGATVHVQNIQHAQALEILDIQVKRHPHIKSDADYYRLLGGMQINLCMSLSEVYSYLTAESLLLKTPILTTPITPILKSAPLSLSVCRSPFYEDPLEIAASIRQIMDNYTEISEAGFEHMHTLNELNKGIVAEVRKKWLE